MRIRRVTDCESPMAEPGVGSQYRQVLLEKRAAILSALDAKVGSFARNDRVGDEDQAQHSHAEFISLRLNGMEYDQLRQIQDALQRLETGEYGRCQSCDDPIPEKRLRALPWARYCVHCQERRGDFIYRESPRFIAQDESAW